VQVGTGNGWHDWYAAHGVTTQLYPVGVAAHTLYDAFGSAAGSSLLPHAARLVLGSHAACLQLATPLNVTQSCPAAHAVTVNALPSVHWVTALLSGVHCVSPT
jgi:hypothetical protein